MKKNIWAMAGVMAFFISLAGCAPTAFKVIPVPIGERLQETVVVTDRGYFLPKIALIDIDGMLLNARESVIFGTGENPTALIVEKLQRAASDPQVRAVVLRINSPGGTVTATEIIYREVLKVRAGDPERGRAAKPVVASMMDIGASGGYFVACGATHIVSEPTTVTGSIGVVMLTLNAKGLLDKIGVSTEAIKSGPKKDAGSPFRPMDPEERMIFQSMIDEYYHRFLAVVSEARTGIDETEIRQIADGRVYTGCQALQLGLIDQTGGLECAIERAKELAGTDAARVVMYHRPVGYRGTIYSISDPVPSQNSNVTNVFNVNVADLLQKQAAFMYLWQP